MAICEIIKDEAFLTQKSDRVTKDDDIQSIIKDLIDTANEHKETCLGIAAVQIGIHKRICIVRDGEEGWMPFINPMIIGHGNRSYISSEGCLSLEGEREVKRWETVTIMHGLGKVKKIRLGKTYSVILQHEIDHFNGILI